MPVPSADDLDAPFPLCPCAFDVEEDWFLAEVFGSPFVFEAVRPFAPVDSAVPDAVLPAPDCFWDAWFPDGAEAFPLPPEAFWDPVAWEAADLPLLCLPLPDVCRPVAAFSAEPCLPVPSADDLDAPFPLCPCAFDVEEDWFLAEVFGSPFVFEAVRPFAPVDSAVPDAVFPAPDCF
ncbi:MAG: hypothetical protein ABEK75_03080 [Salinibacter sp.]